MLSNKDDNWETESKQQCPDAGSAASVGVAAGTNDGNAFFSIMETMQANLLELNLNVKGLSEQQKELGEGQKKLGEEFDLKVKGLSEQQKKLGEEFDSRMPKSSLPQSPAQYGKELYDRMSQDPCLIKQFQPRASGTAIFESPKSEKIEKNLVCQVFSRLRDLLKPHRVLASSEEIPWLQVGATSKSFDKKPDMVGCDKAYFKFHQIREDGMLCGSPSDMRFYGDAILIDAKCANTNEALGELAIHLRYLLFNAKKYSDTDEPVTEARGALVHNYGIRLLRMESTWGRELVEMHWTDIGSAEMFQEFFAPRRNLSLILEEACNKLGVEIIDTNITHRTSFLGAGGTGHVFRVVRKSGPMRGHTNRSRDFLALKIAIGSERIDQLKYESTILPRIPKDIAVSCEEFCDVHVENIVGAALLMSPVGIPIPDKITPVRRLEYLSLALNGMLRIHMVGITHGDPRMQNILLVNEKILFCDFRKSSGAILFSSENQLRSEIVVIAEKIRKDIRDLLESFGHDDSRFKVNDLVEPAVEQYSKCPSETAMATIIAMIRQHVQGVPNSAAASSSSGT